MIKQKWKVIYSEDNAQCDAENCGTEHSSTEHCVEYRYSRLSGKTVLVVDGDSFSVKGKPFGIGVERREVIIVGSYQAILTIGKRGEAELSSAEALEIAVE